MSRSRGRVRAEGGSPKDQWTQGPQGGHKGVSGCDLSSLEQAGLAECRELREALAP